MIGGVLEALGKPGVIDSLLGLFVAACLGFLAFTAVILKWKTVKTRSDFAMFWRFESMIPQGARIDAVSISLLSTGNTEGASLNRMEGDR